MFNPKNVFTKEEIKQIQMFGLSISSRTIPLELKDHYHTSSGKMWDIDTYTHGVCKCLTMEKEEFMEYFDTRKYDDTTMCSNLDLFFKLCEWKVNSFLELRKVDTSYNSVFVVEAGRGIDVLLASLARGETGWDSIQAYDQDKSVLVEMQRYFAGELGLPFKALQINTFNHNFGSINEKTVIFGTCHNLTDAIKKQIHENKNLIVILDGELLEE